MQKSDLTLRRIAERAAEYKKCVNCGLCQAVCPTYLVKGDEALTARGKILLLEALNSGTLQASSTIAAIFDDCLTCYSCKSVCPAGIRTDHLWTAAREDLSHWSSIGKLKQSGLRWTLGNAGIFNSLVKAGGTLFGYSAKNHDSARLGHYRLPLFRGAPYVQQMKEEYNPSDDCIGTVALLLGCSVNMSAPWIADAAVKLLTHSGYRVIVPKEQTCCGAPAINNGAWETAARLAKDVMSLFLKTNADWITSPDATCVGAMKQDYKSLLANDTTNAPDLITFTNRVVQLGHLIEKAVNDGRLQFHPQKNIVTIQDSCHSTHINGMVDWRNTLRHIEGLEIREQEESKVCCGFGGSFQYVHYQTSQKIAARKLTNVLRTKSELLLVGSPGCMLHLSNIARAQQTPKVIPQIKHVIESLAQVAI